WTRGYSSNNDVGYMNESELSELSDNKVLLLQTDLLQRTMMSLVERKDKELERKDKELESKNKELLSLMESKDKEMFSLMKSKEKEMLSLMESKEKEKLSLMESKEKEKLSLMESKEKEHKKELSSLTNEFNEVKNLVENRTQSLLQMKNMVNVRGALEFIRAQILKKDKSIVFTEPIDKALMRLSQDKDFIKILKKACEDNGLRYDDVQHCIRGLYHSASKHFHGHEPQIVIDSRSWTSNEVFVLGIIFRHFKIPFSYCNGDGQPDYYPYKL
ncbi:25657_t:CDS:2, partial [Dentiscutata erythropus]